MASAARCWALGAAVVTAVLALEPQESATQSGDSTCLLQASAGQAAFRGRGQPSSSLLLASAGCPRSADASLFLDESSGQVILANGYVCVSIVSGAITSLSGDLHGEGDFGVNVLAGAGVTFQAEDGAGNVWSSAFLQPSDVQFVVLRNDPGGVELRIEGIQVAGGSRSSSAVAAEAWTLQLMAGDRRLTFRAEGQVLQQASLRAVRRQWEMSPASIYGLFKEGVVQMKAAAKGADFFTSEDHLLRLYSLGGPGKEAAQVGNASLDMLFSEPGAVQNVIMSSDSGKHYWSGLQQVLAGGMKSTLLDKWMPGWGNSPSVEVASNTTWSHTIILGVNNLDFPVARLGVGPNLPQDDLHAALMGIYASPVGCLCTHRNGVKLGARVAQIATTIAQPIRGYSNNYNFFDPDNYISTSAMLWSNDPYLQQQVRAVIERSGAYLTPQGQLPHHFAGLEPVFTALSGAIQTGPNVFWILSAINYAKSAQDLEWLKAYMPTLRHASAFLYNLIDPEIKLAFVQGSLMIDVFIRNNFASDTNAQLVGFFREFAEAEEAVGNSTGAASLRDLASQIAASMNRYLWLPGSDHYVTQWDGPFLNTTRDFVDYDSNLMAAAHGIPSSDQARQILKRIDGGRCRAGPTFVSEKYYGRGDTTYGNIGDSACAMGRIAWFDALARKRYGDAAGFESYILGPLKSALLSTTWMHERMGCDGAQQTNRTPMYFEYPSTVSMLIRAVKYGIDIGFGQIRIQPLGVTSFSYHINEVDIDFSPDHVVVRIPGTGLAQITVGPVAPSATFKLHTVGEDASCSSGQTASQAVSTADGQLQFTAAIGRGCVVSAVKM
ncbi:unnamed protein product [Polarella glacialis]|uniref:Alpha-L-rhamnosidase n=1 Tax=Polarella glacialis TaxID=89957 RepID=A0A813HKZ5_POLGL|nr:unnamed protein product [Polarella glacialis]